MSCEREIETSITIIFSPDDNGWYGEVIEAKTGRTVYTTEVHPTPVKAIREAKSVGVYDEGE